MNVALLRLINYRESIELAGRLETAIRKWTETWAENGGGIVSIVSVPSSDVEAMLADREWCRLYDETGPVAAFGVFGYRHSTMLTLLGAESSSGEAAHVSDVLAALADRAWDALVTQVLEAARGLKVTRTEWGGALEARRIATPLNGYFIAHCSVTPGLDIAIVLWPRAAQRLVDEQSATRVKHSPAPIPTSQALERERVTLQVLVGAAEVAFEDLRTLRVGHVIRLDSRIDQAIEVQLVGDGAICRGFLGARDGHLALQLVQSSKASRSRVQ